MNWLRSRRLAGHFAADDPVKCRNERPPSAVAPQTEGNKEIVMKYRMFGAAALSVALAMTPALARDGHGGGGGVRGGGGGMSHGASFGGASRSVAVGRGGSSFRGQADRSSFRGGNQVARRGQFTRSNQFARGGNFRGNRRGGFGVGLAGGVALGGFGGYYGDDYYGDDAYYGGAYYGGDDYAPSAYAYQEGGVVGSDYCSQRYRSYNPNTGTYTGYDGQPHPCP